MKTKKKFESATFFGQEVAIELSPSYKEKINGKIVESGLIDLLKVEVVLKNLQPVAVVDLKEAIERAKTIRLVTVEFVLEVKFWKMIATPDFSCKILSIKRRRKNEKRT